MTWGLGRCVVKDLHKLFLKVTINLWGCIFKKFFRQLFQKRYTAPPIKKKILTMKKIIKTLLITMLLTSSAFADSGTGEVGVNLIDPIKMDLKDAIEWCKNNPEAVKCDEVIEKLKDHNYKVYTANFE